MVLSVSDNCEETGGELLAEIHVAVSWVNYDVKFLLNFVLQINSCQNVVLSVSDRQAIFISR